jgi:hypothetical protein
MSTWYEIEDSDDIDLSDDGSEVHVLFMSDDTGNHYVSIPVDLLKKLLNEIF